MTHAADVTWRRALSATRPSRSRYLRGRRPVLKLLGPGLAEHDGEAVLTAQADPTTDPLLALRLAARAARAGLPLSPSSVDRLVADAPPLPRALAGCGPRPVHRPARRRASRSCRCGSRSTRPDCSNGCCPSGRWCGTARSATPCTASASTGTWSRRRCCASRLVREVRRPDLLLIAALLHDIGKGQPGDHSVAGAPLAEAVATRIGLPPEDVRTIETLVRHHLLLVETATRRDLDDPATAASVAEALGNTDVLELLHTLTVADAAATGPGAWSDWKAGLVENLVQRTGMRMEGAPPPAAAAADT